MAGLPRAVVWARRTIVVLAPFALLATLALLLSDRVPGMMETLAESLRVDPYVRDGAFGQSPFTIGHLVLWAVLTWLLLVSLGRRQWLLPATIVIAIGSFVSEGLQLVVTSNRGFEAQDVIET